MIIITTNPDHWSDFSENSIGYSFLIPVQIGPVFFSFWGYIYAKISKNDHYNVVMKPMGSPLTMIKHTDYRLCTDYRRSCEICS